MSGKHSSDHREGRGASIERGDRRSSDEMFIARNIAATRTRPPVHMTDGTKCPGCDRPIDILTGACGCSA